MQTLSDMTTAASAKSERRKKILIRSHPEPYRTRIEDLDERRWREEEGIAETETK